MKQLITTASNIKKDTRFVSDKIQNQIIEIYILEAQNIYLLPKIGYEIMQMIFEFQKNHENQLNQKESDSEKTETDILTEKLLHGGEYQKNGRKTTFVGLITTLNYYTYARLVRYSSFHLTRAGLVNKDLSHSTKVISRERKIQELDALTIADFYMEGCMDFISQHKDKLPPCNLKSAMNRLNLRMITPNY